jgi:hypothetical protein
VKRVLAWSPIRSEDDLNWSYLRCVRPIRNIAKRHGYGVGFHGSFRRDLDVIAVPWSNHASPADRFADAIQLALCGHKDASRRWEQKPHGRMATTLAVAMNAFIDLSVSPWIPSTGGASE